MKFKNKYRVVADVYRGYEVQIKRWWLPFWFQCWHDGGINTWSSLETAKKFISYHKKGSFYQED